MSVTPATFKIRFPEYSSEADARIQLFIDDSVIVLNEVYWGDKYDLGISYYTAHLLALAIESAAGNAGFAGPVASKSVDGTSISFSSTGAADQADEFLSSTVYGQRYLALRKTIGVPACVI